MDVFLYITILFLSCITTGLLTAFYCCCKAADLVAPKDREIERLKNEIEKGGKQ